MVIPPSTFLMMSPRRRAARSVIGSSNQAMLLEQRGLVGGNSGATKAEEKQN